MRNPYRYMHFERFESLIQFLKTVVPSAAGILAAVSGGSDSTAMLALLAEARAVLSFPLSAAVVHHGLRKEAANEIELVRRLCRQLDVPLHIAEISPVEAAEAAAKGSLQAWARQRRYQLLEEIARRVNAPFIATGHTRDDQAETVLLHLLRGTGIDGLSGIRRLRALGNGVSVIRPALDFGRQELRDALGERGIAYANDPSNENPRFQRVRVRNELLPLMNELNAGARDHLAALAVEATRLGAYFEDTVLASADLFEPLRLAGGLRVRRCAIESLPFALWGRVIRKALERVQGNLLRIERIHIETLEKYAKDRRTTGRVSLPDGPHVYVDRGDMLFFPGPIPPKPSGFGRPTAVGAGVWKAAFRALGASAEILAGDGPLSPDLEVRTRRPGDRLYGASRKFKEIFIAARVPRPYRDFVPLLVDGDLVVSCPGLVPSRMPGIHVSWTLDESAPFLDLDFGVGASRPIEPEPR